MDLIEIAKMSPTVLYLAGLIYLYKKNQDQAGKMEALVERYHVLVSEQVHTLGLLADRLEDK